MLCIGLGTSTTKTDHRNRTEVSVYWFGVGFVFLGNSVFGFSVSFRVTLNWNWNTVYTNTVEPGATVMSQTLTVHTPATTHIAHESSPQPHRNEPDPHSHSLVLTLCSAQAPKTATTVAHPERAAHPRRVAHWRSMAHRRQAAHRQRAAAVGLWRHGAPRTTPQDREAWNWEAENKSSRFLVFYHTDRELVSQNRSYHNTKNSNQ